MGKGRVQYNTLSDEELVERSKSDKRAVSELIVRYLRTVEYFAGRYDVSIREDMVQEGLMGLLKAVNTYRFDENVKFSTYANVCVRNKIISSMKKNSLTGFEQFYDDSLEERFIGSADEPTPESILMQSERNEEIYNKIISALSEQEWKVFQLFLTGMAYNQMALNLGVTVKSVDNAMQRVRRKLKSVLK
jgi:RNA polymerase sporulation-specific sigma factor